MTKVLVAHRQAAAGSIESYSSWRTCSQVLAQQQLQQVVVLLGWL
jgi:hypothetical protein